MSDILNDPEVWKTKQSTDGVRKPGRVTPTIRKVKENKRQFLDLLLLADEQEDMIERYLDRGDLFVMEDGGQAAAVCVVTEEGRCWRSITPDVYSLLTTCFSQEFQCRN